ncbi:ChaN family lipoprotein [Antarctobacter heliothermus]|uniref:Haem-binding uptake, Tiki superfamily, ChaN n=1 Tax=Antarctobacter heliothermus TaxID=74033 RepID=A0A239C2V9_9RHOB|nr:ChaN family lipoprotein [Antarctobacter heliothermus]SNS14232.1 Haem-binding uptake, Tiki superfamily, ChaN [Antarctobacter heliothermus]
MRNFIFPCLMAFASSAAAEGYTDADVLFLGEVHDNPAHHLRQARIVAEVQPTAVVWEMLGPEAAAKVAPELIDNVAALSVALSWSDSGWPDFSMYYPIFAASPDARHFGAQLSREEARAVMGQGVAEIFGADAAVFGLDAPLAKDQQAQREALQMAAHCDALPFEMLPIMVDIQRLRDAELAAATLSALQETGGPVVVITGNGHARKDWGATYLFLQAAPDVSVFALGQGEVGRSPPEGGFDLIEAVASAVDRGDPCDAFRKN